MWVTEIELNNSGFNIERKLIKDGEVWKKLAFIPGNGTTSQPKGYLYEDKKLNKGIYKYRLKQIDYNGNYEYFELANDIVIAPPNKFELGQNYPNPSNPKSKIDFQLPFRGIVTIRVFDALGQEVSTIINELKDAGYYTAEFDGSRIASGVYFYRIEAKDIVTLQSLIKTMKMVLVK